MGHAKSTKLGDRKCVRMVIVQMSEGGRIGGGVLGWWGCVCVGGAVFMLVVLCGGEL